jgi:hypothetical protein
MLLARIDEDTMRLRIGTEVPGTESPQETGIRLHKDLATRKCNMNLFLLSRYAQMAATTGNTISE